MIPAPQNPTPTETESTRAWSPLRWALLCVAFFSASILWLGITSVYVPPLYTLTQHSTQLYRGYTLIALAVAVGIFHRWLAYKILWLGQKLYRSMSALVMMGIVWIEASAHLLSIPHMEGWWIALFSGGMASGIAAWIKTLSRRPKTPIL